MSLLYFLYPFLLIIVFVFYSLVALKYELHMMQQNSYRNERYLKWLKRDFFSFSRIMDFVCLILLFSAEFFLSSSIYMIMAGTIGAILLVKAIIILKRKSKKPLVFTARAKRLYIAACVLLLVIDYILSIPFRSNVFFALMLMAWLSFAVIMLAVIVMQPIESSINRGYYNDAKRILAGMPDLKIIGITGSYGKTSTKHYLYRMLSEKYNVLMTPGNFNTTLGVIRTVREHMKPYHNVFICEMGAKQLNDIKEICDLVNPHIGIITAVGEQHLESFKTIENIQKTKFELVDALPKDGLAVLNADFPYVANRPVSNVDKVAYYSMEENNPKAEYWIANVSYSAEATRFDIKNKSGDSETFETKLIGSYNLSNLLAGYIVSKELGLTTQEIKYAMAQIEQVEHRLSLKYTAAGFTILDDAYNSNPYGARMAMEVIKSFTTGKRIVVTPGFIELGDKQYELNYELGKQMASSCDFAIVVGEYNRAALTNGLKDAGFAIENLYEAPTFNDATLKLQTIITRGDVVLYENDLPDVFK
ncbi:UDP-N-acetylmuramoyl-tripeptide--D-alanyl-D-alanine ligase [Dysgonomonas sp. 25]|nr:UDP-N-acetylmuramoyl-tripeptide--D-alanyl-D-alanine ligase [Dysgonomonas sp. 25]